MPKKRSFNSAKLELKKSGDYSKEATVDSKPNRRIMNKVAMLESQVLAMRKRIIELEAEKK